jgi:glutamate N-acetyltransferase/amino-acid N-acetyltransferase
VTTGSAPGRPLGPLPMTLPDVEVRARLPDGFRAGAARAGIKPSGRPDLAVVVVEHGPGSAAATFTTNQLAAAPVQLSRRHLAATSPDRSSSYGRVDAIISTSGSANAATGQPGLSDQRRLAAALAAATGTIPERTLAVSTGMIGTRLPMDRILAELDALVGSGLSSEDGALEAVAEAMCTTDTRVKLATVTVELPGRDGRPMPVTVSGVAKGVGMIHPNMATMLAFVLTDAAAEPAVLSSLLRPAVARTWNQLTVDGDMSTNDTVILVASGASGALPVAAESEAATVLGAAVEAVARSLARQQAADGEGATTLITCQVSGARDDAEARAVARAVTRSSLLKAAVHGRDANWGRVAGAAGTARLAGALELEAGGMPRDEAARRRGAPVVLDPATLRIGICGTDVFAGVPLPFDRTAVGAAMKAPEVLIRLDLGSGSGSGEAFGCDLTEQYVRENAEYST